jgi:hypothetical protein
MSYNAPNFTDGLPAGANRVVLRDWTQGASTVNGNIDGILWASANVNSPQYSPSALCELVSASLISGSANRWTYVIKIWHPTPLTGTGVTVPRDYTFDYTECINLREWHNTALLVDGMDITSPPSTVGPVGSTYISGSWQLSELTAKVEVHIAYDTAGGAFAYFDRPNPIRCT